MAQKLAIDKRALFEDLAYRPHAGQRLVHESKARQRVVVAGVRWGKSVAAAAEAIAASMAPAESSLGWIVTPNTAVTDLLFRQIRAMIQQHLPHRVVRIDARERCIVLRNLLGGASEIRGRSAENPTTLLGAGLDWVIVDDAAGFDDEVWPSFLAPRLVDRSGWSLLLSTPRGCGWFEEMFRVSQEGADPEYESWRFPSWTSPYVDAGAIERERERVNPGVFAELYAAEFVGPEGPACLACGWPETRTTEAALVFEGTEDPRDCSACGRLVDYRGRPIGWPEEVRLVNLCAAEGSEVESYSP